MDIKKKLKNHTPTVLGSKEFAKFAVLLPLIEHEKEPHVLFEVRSHQMRRQPGEICFPGGRIEGEDTTAKEAALRETKEELGIGEEHLSDAYPLDYLVSPFGMIVYPFAGYLDVTTSNLKPNPMEVSEVFTVPLSFFKKTKPDIHHVNFQASPEENFPFDLIPFGKDYNWRSRSLEEYFYVYGDKVIWGMTARILAHFIDLITSDRT
ncbi:NUDIX hydrolase [Thalassobacillus pellis]|uniref:NUDIX hydrolase n=1 Tax=Thalassobacillus pellis TaxID=748008 RepID=UPI0019617AF7|nr:CoA pyrophosphatase [Thalassobacillus pellis]MBM7552134.1 8-oxo-dGTP pyrophosphatase MutT (NUDIX family) [Thalassobacillus pellis]